MENNNAIAAKPEDGESKIEVENVKPTVEDTDSSPNNRNRGYRYNRRRRPPMRRDVNPEDETAKAAIRRKIWDHFEDENLVNAPRPCHYRIPNFEGAVEAADKLTSLDEFKNAKTVKVNSDKAQEHVRFLVLEAEKDLVLLNQNEKDLMVPTAELKCGLLNRVVAPEGANTEELKHCVTTQGVKENGKEIGLEDKVKLDIIFVGSVAVSRNGYRIGKGKGYADLEYAMMRTMGAANASTVVITSVHDSQVVDIADDLVGDHDITVDYILTPTEVIKTNSKKQRPSGVIWNHLEVNKFYQVPVLRQLRKNEKDDGKDVLLKDQKEEDEDPVDAMEPPRPRRYTRYRGGGGGGYRGRGRSYGRYRRGGSRRRQYDGEDSNKENHDAAEDSGADGDNEGRPNRRPPPRNSYRNRRYRRGGGGGGGNRRLRASESEHSDGNAIDDHRDDGDDKPRQRRYSNRRRYNPRRRYDNRRDNPRDDQSGSDGEQKNSADEEYENRRPRRNRIQTNPDAVVYVGSLPRSLRVSQLKAELRKHDIKTIRLLWRGTQGFAKLFFMEVEGAKEAINSLTGTELLGRELNVQMSNNDRRRSNRNDNRVSEEPEQDEE